MAAKVKGRTHLRRSPLAALLRLWARVLLAAISVGALGSVAHARTLAGVAAPENSPLGLGGNSVPAHVGAELAQPTETPLESAFGYGQVASDSAYATRGGQKLLSQFARSTVDDVLASAGRLRSGGQISEGARAIAKKLGHAEAGGFQSAFAGLKPTQANAEAIIRSALESPAHTFYGNKVIDVYNAAGQGVRFDRATNAFMGFLERSLAR